MELLNPITQIPRARIATIFDSTPFIDEFRLEVRYTNVSCVPKLGWTSKIRRIHIPDLVWAKDFGVCKDKYTFPLPVRRIDSLDGNEWSVIMSINFWDRPLAYFRLTRSEYERLLKNRRGKSIVAPFCISDSGENEFHLTLAVMNDYRLFPVGYMEKSYLEHWIVELQGYKHIIGTLVEFLLLFE